MFSREDLVGGAEAVGGVGFDPEPDFLTGDETFCGEVVAEIVFGTDGLGLPPHSMDFIEAGGKAEEIDAEGGIGPGSIVTAADSFGGTGEEGEFPDVIDALIVAADGLKRCFG